MTIEVTVHISRDGNQFVAHAMPIDVMSSGPTPEAARRALDEAVGLFLTTAADADTLSDVLEECGYVCRDDTWACPEFVSVERRALAVAL